ncbi:MAG: ATP-binding cassette domain-containing protein [Candidatus Woesearchaeota archaeon]|jgi:ABC-2 type transport system ATP-binding protein|nr:ATP-binding cassette domain-containing protein [Candidatus Woesearchaeota archaeon]
MNKNIIEVKNLRKVFKVPKKSKDLSWMKKRLSWVYREWEEKVAVVDIDLEIKEGEILGYLGPNGAGKSTTIKMLTGILHPTLGDIKVFGNLNPVKDRNEYTQQIGVVFGQRSILAYDIPVKDSFRLFKAIYGLSEEFYQERVEYLVKMLGIEEFFERPYRMLSLGEKMRCELAASFLHKPKIVFLDEPTIGLDASAKIAIRKFLRKINREEGVTIMITTHDMDDIEELCSRIVLIDEGIVAYEGSLNKFKEKYSDWKRVSFYYKKVHDKAKLERLRKNLDVIEEIDYNITIKIPANDSLGKYLSQIVESVEIIDLTIQEPKLENIVAKIYETRKGM